MAAAPPTISATCQTSGEGSEARRRTLGDTSEVVDRIQGCGLLFHTMARPSRASGSITFGPPTNVTPDINPSRAGEA